MDTDFKATHLKIATEAYGHQAIDSRGKYQPRGGRTPEVSQATMKTHLQKYESHL